MNFEQAAAGALGSFLSSIGGELQKEQEASDLTAQRQQVLKERAELVSGRIVLCNSWLALIESLKSFPDLRDSFARHLSNQGICLERVERVCRETLQKGN